MKTIPLTKGKFAIVDDEDFEWLNQWKWQLSWNGYAIRHKHIRLGLHKYTSEIVRMHRLINKTPLGNLTDHINRDKLDNRKINLRNANKSINSINRDRPSNNKSGIRGVYWDKFNNKWRAELKINGIKKSLGRFFDKRDAVLARKEAERIYYVI
jgi:hypothetical protein